MMGNRIGGTDNKKSRIKNNNLFEYGAQSLKYYKSTEFKFKLN